MPELPHDQEILDIVNEHDVVVGSITHEAAFDEANLKGGYLRAANALIINSGGQLWIPRRTDDKLIWPNGLDYSMGEHVMSGETYEQATIRGFEEELNLQITADQLELISKVLPIPGLPPYFNVNYLIRSDATPTYNPHDFKSAEWVEPQVLLQRIRGGEAAKYYMVEGIESLIAYLLQNESDQDRHE